MELIGGYTIQPATEADIPTLTDFLVKSKRHLAINRFLFIHWPAEEDQHANYGTAVRGGITDPDISSLKVVHTNTNRTVAYLVVARSGRPETPRQVGNEESQRQRKEAENRRDLTGVINPAVVEAVNDAFKQLGIPEGEYLEIKYIYVEPSSRRLGIGTQLVRQCLDRANWERLPLTINAEPNHHDWFLRRGFVDVCAVDIDLRAFAPRDSGYGPFRISRMALRRNGLW
ncbi:hypothetical protein GGR53DRAFT_470488 [Hypoxylon sp. FL1150]|nr:hypothetical protein GGR53DRAFT_470488 [Hypoxylon sp. FL1150]